MEELKIDLYGGYEHWSFTGCGIDNRIWTYSVNYCGPTITEDGWKESCNFFNVEVKGSGDSYNIIKTADYKQYYSKNGNKEDLEALNKRALTIARNIARLIKEKIIPRKFREDVQIKEEIYDWRITIKDVLNQKN